MLAEVDEISARLHHIVDSYKDQNYPNPVKVAITYYHQCLNRNHRYIDRYVCNITSKFKSQHANHSIIF